MYCCLCHTEASVTHSSSSGHHAAQKLVSAALERLTNFCAAFEDSTEGSVNVSTDTEKTKSPDAFSYCDICNSVYPINEQSSHYRLKKHALALLDGQDLEELVLTYIGEEPKLETTTSEASDDAAFVDVTEVRKTYKCHICALEVPCVFKAEHVRSSRHRVNRMFALAVARRARDVFSHADGSGDESGDKIKFTGKMMRKLLKVYQGIHEVANEEPEPNAEPVSNKPEPKLTPKEYFTQILPFLPYVGTFNTLYIDETEFVAIKICNQILRIHVNNFNGIYNMEDGLYMNCRLCDSYPQICYSALGQDDKKHIMSLGHIKNVLSPIDNIHLIRKIDNTHYICGLCNVQISPNTHSVETHIFKDTKHTAALTEALERGRDFIETKDHVKITLYLPSVSKPSGFQMNQNNQNKWTFGIPQQPKYSLFGTGFGTAQNNCFGGQSSVAFGSSQNTGFGNASVQNTGFGNANAQTTGFANTGPQGTSFGSAQTGSDGFSVQCKTGLFGASQNKSTGFGTAQSNATGFGASQNCNNVFGAPLNRPSVFGAPQNNASAFGASQKHPTGFGASQNNPTGFGAPQNNSTGFGAAQNTPTGFGAPRNNATGSIANQIGFGAVQNNSSTITASPNNDGATQNIGPIKAKPLTTAQNTGFGAEPTQTTGFGGQQKNASIFTGKQKNDINSGVNPNNNLVLGPTKKGDPITFGINQNQKETNKKINFGINDSLQQTETKKNVDSPTKDIPFKTTPEKTPDFKFKNLSEPEAKKSQIPNDPVKLTNEHNINRNKRSPPRKYNYSTSSSDSE